MWLTLLSTIPFALFFSFARYFIGHAMERNSYLGAVITGMSHSIGVLLLSGASLMMLPADDCFLPLHDVLLSFSGGYFLNDLVVVTMIKADSRFVMHHLVALTAYSLFLYCRQGAFVLSWLMFLGEITNPFQNICDMFRQGYYMRKMMRLSVLQFQTIRYFFCYFFILVRMVLIPSFLGFCFVRNQFATLPPLLTYTTWVSSSVILIGSVSWCKSLLEEKDKNLDKMV